MRAIIEHIICVWLLSQGNQPSLQGSVTAVHMVRLPDGYDCINAGPLRRL